MLSTRGSGRADVDEIEALLAAGLDPSSVDETGLTPLFSMLLQGEYGPSPKKGIVRLLLDYGAVLSPNEKEKEAIRTLHEEAGDSKDIPFVNRLEKLRRLGFTIESCETAATPDIIYWQSDGCDNIQCTHVKNPEQHPLRCVLS